MKSFIFSLSILAFSLFSYLSHADEFQDRARIASEREAAERLEQLLSARLENMHAYYRQLSGFAKAHGGLAAGGVCQAWPLGNCRSEFCPGGDQQNIPFETLAGDAIYIVSYCDLNVGRDLACSVSRDYSSDNLTRYNATCYDEKSVKHEFSFGGGAPKPTGKGLGHSRSKRHR